ncbi:MAG: nucleotide exchange factor GrpE [Cyanobacteria bacterium J06649_4]
MAQSPREKAAQKLQQRKQQEKLLSDLLTVVDALDRATEHWQRAEQRQEESRTAASSVETEVKTAWWQRWLPWFSGNVTTATEQITTESQTLSEVVISAKEGVDMIRASMLSVLSQHQVTPIPAKGEAFDPTFMHALSQQPDASVPPNTVVQEIVRGYRWKDRTLREAQVIVAVSPKDSSTDAL